MVLMQLEPVLWPNWAIDWLLKESSTEVNFIIEIRNVKHTAETFLDAHLFNHKHTSKCNVMLVDVVAKDLFEDAPGPHFAIERFVSSSGFIHKELMLKTLGPLRRNTFWFTAISEVSNNFLPSLKHPFHSGTKDVEVRPTSTFKWTTERHNPTSPDADSNLISQARSIELVWIPFSIEWKLLKDFKVNSIDRN